MFKNVICGMYVLIGVNVALELANINYNISQCKMIFLDTHKAMIIQNRCLQEISTALMIDLQDSPKKN